MRAFCCSTRLLVGGSGLWDAGAQGGDRVTNREAQQVFAEQHRPAIRAPRAL